MKNLFLSLLLLMVLAACLKTPSSSRQLLIGMQKTACYGSCPVYTLEIYDDGSVLYQGVRFVPLEGEHLFTIRKNVLESMISTFLQNGIFEFQSDYSKGISDLPTTFLEFNYEGKSKKIRDYYGAPEKLKELESLVEDFVEKNIWKSRSN